VNQQRHNYVETSCWASHLLDLW